MLKTEIKTQEKALQEDCPIEKIELAKENVVEQGELVKIADNCEHVVLENCMETISAQEIAQETSKENAENKDENVLEEEQAKKDSIYDDLNLLASLLDKTVDDLKEEFYLLQIRKIMSKLQKVIVRYNMTDLELENLFYCGGQYGLGGITVAPAYLDSQIKQNKKNFTGRLKITSLIDFPFGESSLKGKVANIKESLRLGANSLAVCLPSSFVDKEQKKQFKKQCKKIYRQANWWKKNEIGIVLNASDINEENFSIAVKVLRKIKLSFVVLAFGDANIEEVKHKLVVLNGLGLNKKLYVLANVDKVEMAVELFRLKVDSILTPYADSIGTDLLKRFNLIAK
ncbi:MAG: hypothetical protein E7372_02095 [Clostridiales bacterium]|nr:hypothetical protein [Clostridiales bacterium]